MPRKPARPPSWGVELTRSAQRDLDHILEFIAQGTGPRAALRMIERLERAIASLSLFPERGSIPRELADVGVKDYRQLSIPPYRIVYRVHETRVVVYLVVDGRRDLKSVLTQRLLKP